VLRLQYNVPATARYGDPLGSSPQPVQFFRGGSDLDFMFFRSEQTAAGFRFEGAFLVGPSVVGLQVPSTIAGTDRRGIGVGPSFEVAADFRLPYLPDLHVRAAMGTDVVLAMMGGVNPFQFGLRSSLALCWRFGSTN